MHAPESHADDPARKTPEPSPSVVVGGTGRACGKVILLGEHAVVYGVPALAVGIDRGATATVAASKGPSSVLEVPGWETSVSEGGTSDLARAFTALLARAREEGGAVSRGALRVVAQAELPPGGGLGCSAALGVAIARALVPGVSTEGAAGIATAWERVFHGNPSGIDAAVAAHGGSILFEKGSPMRSVHLKEPLTVCIGSTGVASSTKTMVDGVAALREKKPELAEKTFSAIASLVRNAELALGAGDKVGLGKLMDLNQMLLAGLLVSTEEIERLCSLARENGALGAKLTGAGGGGCVVALADEGTADAIVRGWMAAGFTGFVTRVCPSIGGRE